MIEQTGIVNQQDLFTCRRLSCPYLQPAVSQGNQLRICEAAKIILEAEAEMLILPRNTYTRSDGTTELTPDARRITRTGALLFLRQNFGPVPTGCPNLFDQPQTT